MGKALSFCQGKGSIAHNNRLFKCKNVHAERTKDNVTLVKIPIGKAYDTCFGEAVKDYNNKQKRKDRRIDDNYFRELFGREACNTVCTGSNKQKSFYEDLVQVGDMNDSGIGTADAELVKQVLLKYWEGFRERNPNLYVFNCVLHMDEATPHMHIDWIPLGHYSRGLSVQNGLAQALKEQGYGSGPNAISRWREAERKALEEVCKEYGIEVSPPKKSRGSMTVEQYKEYKELEKKIENAKQELTALNDRLDDLKDLESNIKTQADIFIKAKPKRFNKDIAEIPYAVLREGVSVLQKALVDSYDYRDDLAEANRNIGKLENTVQFQRGLIDKYKEQAKGYDKAMAFIRDKGLQAEYTGYRVTKHVLTRQGYER